MKENLSILDQRGTRLSADTAQVLIQLGRGFAFVRKFDQAIAAENEAKEIIMKIVGENSPNLPNVYKAMGEVYLASGDRAHAIEQLDLAINGFKKAFVNHREIGKCEDLKRKAERL